jgi:hypothetical protein
MGAWVVVSAGWYNNLIWDIRQWVSERLMTKSIFNDAHAVLIKELVSARKAVNLKQSAVAAILGKPQSFVSKYERSERRLDTIEFVIVCRALGASPDGILSRVKAAISDETEL